MSEATRRLGRFDSGLYAALLAGAAGLFFQSTTAFLTGAVALAYVAYGRVAHTPDPDLAVERRLSEESPSPGQTVTVTLTVTNVGESALPDVRVRDAVPGALTVTDGAPALATSLRPGETATLSYEVEAERGTFAFGAASVAVRSVSGGRERRIDPDVRSELVCRTHVESVPLASETVSHTGRVDTDTGGEGLEFYSTRDYYPGDPLSRIDWNRLASTDELATINFRETRAATVIVAVDAGESTAVAPGPDAPTGLERGRFAASRIVDALLDEHNRVGAARVGSEPRYVAPGTGGDQSLRARRLFGGEREVGTALAGRRSAERLRKRVPTDAQVVFCSPCLDEGAVEFARRFLAHGHAVTVVSPDVTNGATLGGTVERVDRDLRLRSIRRAGARTVDWSLDEPLDEALTRAAHGWS